MSKIANGFVGNFATLVELTTKYPPSEFTGCSANVGTLTINKAYSNGVVWAELNAPALQAAVSGGGNRLVATRCAPPGGSAPGNFQLQARSRHWATADITALQLEYAGWYVTNPTGENNQISTSTYTAAIEYPTGTYTRVTFGGAAAGVCAPGENLLSDACAVVIPRGAAFWVRVYQTNPTGVVLLGGATSSIYGEACNIAASGLSDTTMGGAITNSQPTLSCRPSAIVGYSARPAFALFGDSKAAGTGDSLTDAYLLQGELQRGIGHRAGWTALAVGGERAQQVAGGNAVKRIALARRYCTHAVANYGINDASSGRTSSQWYTDIQTFRSLLGMPLFMSTIAPVSTGTWTTTGGQTTAAFNAARVDMNTSIRTNMAGLIEGYAEVSDLMEFTRDSGIWNAPGYTADGTHETPLAYTLIQNSPAAFAAILAQTLGGR